jgi:hypothetical protein
VLVRTDIPLAGQIVQAGHACLEAGFRFERPQSPTHLVLLSVPSERHLLGAVDRIEAAGIRCVVFHEPDDNLGQTAACTQPVEGRRRRYFRKFPLWRDPGVTGQARPPPPAPPGAAHL